MNRLQKASYYVLHQPYGAIPFKDSEQHPAIEGYTYSGNDTFYIVFRASSTIMDYLVNFQFPTAKLFSHNSYRAHGGYVRHYRRLHYELLSRQMISDTTKVHIIGYSMGASVAQICGAYLLHENIPNIQITSFEPLPIANKDLQIHLEKHCDVHYTTYGNDIVTKLLPWNHHVGYHHHFGQPSKWWKLSIQDHPFDNLVPCIFDYK